ncbi:hypothetical protein AB0E59_35775 [Lentzea sp. NPDC034063]|uniref:hypothetical protein n=1 Tax=unclassified Lentzea TaxID=2643253 RepID=UPI0033EFBA7B
MAIVFCRLTTGPSNHGVDRTVESQGEDCGAVSVQEYTSELLRSSPTFDVMIDDDRTNLERSHREASVRNR